MDQCAFSDMEYGLKKHLARREKLLSRMDGLIPWEKLEGRVRPHYPKAGRGIGGFLYVKWRFGYAKARHRGLAKNRQRIARLLGLANLMIGERHLAGA